MADTKISALTDGAPPVGSTDYTVIARSGANYKMSLTAIFASPPTLGGAIAAAFAGEDTLTAHAGGGQASALVLSAAVNMHRVATVATAGDSVKFPAATVGATHYLRNDGANAMQVFGTGTDTINGVASGTGVSHPKGIGAWYVCTTAGAWTATVVGSIDGTGAATFTTLIATTSPSTLGDGSAANHTLAANLSGATDPSIIFVDGGVSVNAGGSQLAAINGSGINLGAANDSWLARTAGNAIRFGAAAGATTTSRTEFNKSVTAIADAAATAALTITIPNAAHSASLLVRVTGSAGAGGSIGANEATATNTYIISLTRTAGVNAVAAISTAFGAAASTVAGGNSITATAAVSAVSGAVGASNTFTVNVTITRSAGAATNHTCLVYAQLMNANVTGITIS